MAFHQLIQRCLLVGVDVEVGERPPAPRAPERLLPLIQSIADAHARFDARAVEFGHRYRSAFWIIYLLSAIAVLFAVMPLALGWDDARHFMHPWVFIWPLGEVGIILAVGMIYFTGHRRDWQGQWLAARTQAELTWYLPLVAPLAEFGDARNEVNWYARVFEPGQAVHTAPEVDRLCAANEPEARRLLASAWEDPGFATDYARWTIEVLEDQRYYHARVGRRQRALLRRVHTLNNRLFGLTVVGALMHLAVHSLWLSVVTTFFPALGASLHGALAQSEAYRLAVTAERLDFELKDAIARIRAAQADGAQDELRTAVREAIAVILEEHQDWHMLVQPHHLPLG